MLETADPVTYQLAALEGAVMAALALGGLRDPGLWRRMVDEMERSPALTVVVGLIAALFGALVLLLPGGWSDPLAAVVSGVALLSLVKGLALIAVPGVWLGLGRPLLGAARPWAAALGLAGLLLLLAGVAGMLL